tara:strand:+ start:1040 stop:1198 length:159 start_codon:yes stop_codon:yes gene_type:complete
MKNIKIKETKDNKFIIEKQWPISGAINTIILNKEEVIQLTKELIRLEKEVIK